MARVTHIYVQGCARSGNTLMRELCLSGFRETKLVQSSETNLECGLDLFIKPQQRKFLESKATVFVASRDRDCMYSMSLEMVRSHPGLHVIWMLRNPLDVLTSIHPHKPDRFYMSPGRWMETIELYKKFEKEPQVMTVRYEELVSNPQAVQKRIAETCSLEPVRCFTESHAFFSKSPTAVQALHSIRPIDSDSVEKWKKNPEYRDYL
jgi:Sulfotransferase domain